MKQVVELEDAQSRLAELVTQLKSSDEIVLARDGEAVARITSVSRATKPRIPGLRPGSIRASADFDAPLPDEFWSPS